MSRDGALVAPHENELSRSTDIASRPQFADRRTTKEVNGAELTGWFTEDFTLAELRTLRAIERMPGLRPLNTPYGGRFGIARLIAAGQDVDQEVSGFYDEVLTEVADRIEVSGSIGKVDIGALLFWKRLRANTPWVGKRWSRPGRDRSEEAAQQPSGVSRPVHPQPA